MKKCILLLFLLHIIGLTGCTNSNPVTETIVGTQPPVPSTTAPEKTDYSLPGVSVEDVILYFNEVCLDAEMEHSGDSSLLQKWVVPISYYMYGQTSKEDRETLETFAGWLNTIDGFPGIQETTIPAEANLRIHFCSHSEMLSLMGESFTDMDGAVTFWYQDNAIYDAIICCRTDLDQPLRNSVILEELYNGLGPIQDTALRPDSIIYADFSQPQALTDMDELILKLLYHPDLTCGMDETACEAAIRQLYRQPQHLPAP